MLTRFRVGDYFRSNAVVRDVIKGGMGVIYIVEFLDAHGRMCAVKSIPSDLLLRLRGAARFERECQLWLALLPHPNVVRAHTCDKSLGMSYLVLEYVSGGNLRRYIVPRLSVKRILSFSLQICEAMTFLNGVCGLVHRDLKPENILVTDDHHVKVTDLGLAHGYSSLYTHIAHGDHMTDELRDIVETHKGVIMGTLPYMSPEQLRDPHGVGQSADIYSFGVVMYEMLTGRLPFSETSFRELVNAHFRTTPTPPIDVDIHIPRELSKICHKCLEKSPERRYANFTALGDELTAFCVSNQLSQLVPKHYTVPELEDRLTDADWVSRGFSLRELQLYDEAVACYDRAIVLNPQFSVAHGNKAAALMLAGRLEEAKECAERAINLDPTTPVWGARLANIEHLQGHHAIDLERIRQLAEKNASNLEMVVLYLKWCVQELAPEAILPSLDKFEEVLREHAAHTVMLGVVCSDEGLPSVALRLFDIVLGHDPANAPALYNKGVVLQRQGQQEAALRHYRQAIKLYREVPPYLYINIGIILFNNGRLCEAMRSWAEAVRLYPDTDFGPALKEFVASANNVMESVSPEHWDALAVAMEPLVNTLKVHHFL